MCDNNENIQKNLFELLCDLREIKNQFKILNDSKAEEISKLLNEKKKIPFHLFWINKYKTISQQIDNLTETLTKESGDNKDVIKIEKKVEETCDSILKKLDKINCQSSKQSNAQDNAVEEVKKYKQLLDDGIITPKEFQSKKKQILGL
ncbi:SHOCT domain-containing protein [Ligilactobacillus aviarius]|uniref:SHOCT domain-containing protein n=1 Tax=Ligilactobacillus aviarius TaxID=1606 RepID=UPI0024B9FDEF|nr:SHOCT domain-containing protein [Ligilactobacillus aviarius]